MACRLRRCARSVASGQQSCVCYCELRGDAETAVELFQTEAPGPARSKPRPARGPTSHRRGPRAMLDCYEPQGQPNGSLFHGLGLGGAALPEKPRGWGRARGPGCPGTRGSGAGGHHVTKIKTTLPCPKIVLNRHSKNFMSGSLADFCSARRPLRSAAMAAPSPTTGR